MKEINNEIAAKLEPWNVDVSFVQKRPEAGTITIAAVDEAGARATINEMFPADSELKIIQAYRVADCPSIREILAEKNPSYQDKKELN